MQQLLVFFSYCFISEGTLLTGKITGDPGFIGSFAPKCRGIQATGGDLHLRNCTIGQNYYFFCTALSAAFLLVGLAVIENIPLTVDLYHATVGIAGIVQRLHSAFKANVTNTDDGTAIVESFVGVLAHRIAKLMAFLGGIHKIILFVDLPGRTGLKESMPLKLCSLRFYWTGNGDHFATPDCFHISFQLQTDTFLHIVAPHFQDVLEETGFGRKAYIQIDLPIVIYQHTRVESKNLPLFAAPGMSIRMLDIAIEFILARRGVTDSHRGDIQFVELIIEVVPSVRTLHHIGCTHMHLSFGILGVLIFTVDNAFFAPIRKIGYRRRPTYIIAQAEVRAIKVIVTAIYIQSVTKNSRFAIRHIFITRQIGIECLH